MDLIDILTARGKAFADFAHVFISLRGYDVYVML